MTAAPGTAPGGGAQEAATPLPKFLGHPDDLCEQWMAETWETDYGSTGVSYDREALQSAYRAGRDEARRQLAPAWDALVGERDRAKNGARTLGTDVMTHVLGEELERLRIGDADLRRRLDDLASQWEGIFVHAGCARELRDVLEARDDQ